MWITDPMGTLYFWSRSRTVDLWLKRTCIFEPEYKPDYTSEYKPDYTTRTSRSTFWNTIRRRTLSRRTNSARTKFHQRQSGDSTRTYLSKPLQTHCDWICRQFTFLAEHSGQNTTQRQEVTRKPTVEIGAASEKKSENLVLGIVLHVF